MDRLEKWKTATPWEMQALLKAYEDTGLTPEQVQELTKAKAEGRLVVLPCKVGDTVYRIAKVRNSRGFRNLCIIGDEVLRFWVGDDGRLWMLAGSYNQRCDTIGHSVFITREAAEKALEVGE